MKVLLLGSGGYLGQHLLAKYPDAVTQKVDIADQQAVSNALDEIKPDVVVNAAGKTGRPNVDWCEDHKIETLRANVTGPLVLLEECAKRDLYWVHLGSGCIYEGDNEGKGFCEEDPPNFYGSFYARTKAWIDWVLKDFPVLVLRLRMPFDGTQHPRNLLSKLVSYDRILDVQNSLTFIPDFLEAAESLIAKRKTGIYNIVNPGTISPYEIMEMYKNIVQPDHAFQRLEEADLSDVVRAGRSNCVLNSEKVQKEGITVPDVKQRVEEALEQWKAAGSS